MCSDEKKYSKSEILEKIHAERKIFEKSLSVFTDEQLILGGVIGEWSIKDILAHITAWEQRLLKWVKISIVGKEPEDFPDTMEEVNAMNVASYAVDKKKPLSLVKKEFAESFPQAVQSVESISEDMLADPEYFKWRKTPFWVMVAANTWWHYKEHQEDIQKAIEKFKDAN